MDYYSERYWRQNYYDRYVPPQPAPPAKKMEQPAQSDRYAKNVTNRISSKF